ncbi:MAG TPA: thioredoxin domain-containing protein [Candidatus Eisenbacteria bacterium]|nr:thioredoxin domain-containing protein [Candidatus Eisenbacteria bacterium]
MSPTSPHDAHATRPANRLAGEKSPYLLQHARNPVDWWPWGEPAFAEARASRRPIFLSIGYSTCHWCHVMERESFEDESVAELMNRWFVPIKVDREERPDVDRIYMTAAQAMGLGGGWPLNVFLTPELEPFYAGTYFPPEARGGHAGLKQVLASVHQAWEERRGDLEQAGRTVLGALERSEAAPQTTAAREELFVQAAQWFADTEDRGCGGFGHAPKFPTVANLGFLLRWWVRDPNAHAGALDIVLRQLDAMQRGGIHDHLGGGFHRYSVDRGWNVPHFEKMLYDQAQLAVVYLEAFQATSRAEYAAVARGVLEYVARDLSHGGGGFDSAEDADSEGEEGRFYVWTPDALAAALPADQAELFAFVYGVAPHGNFEGGATVLSEVHDAAAAADRFQLGLDEVAARLAAARATLLAARARRVRPHRDDKVIAAWNGLMISAFARGAGVLDDEALAARASQAAEFAWERLRDPASGALNRRWRDGEAAGDGQLDDHADLATGFLDLFAATSEPRWLARAAALAEQLVARFRDPDEGGWFESPEGDPSIKVRMKNGFDGAELAGNSVAAELLARLGRLLDRHDWQAEAERTFDAYARRLNGGAMAMPRMLSAMLLAETPARDIVIAGDPAAADTRAMRRAVEARFLPGALAVVRDPARAAALGELLPWVAPLAPRAGRATAYVCVDHVCQLPITDSTALAAALDANANPKENA